MGSDQSAQSGVGAGRAIVAIGTNMPFGALAGDALISAALTHLGGEGFRVLAVSTRRVTAAWPVPTDPPFTNAVALLHASQGSAQAVLASLLRTEAAFGRTRGIRNAPRTLDLDLLDFDGQVIDAPGLELPHPRLHARAFVLEPLAEILPGWRHPVNGKTAAQMWAELAKD